MPINPNGLINLKSGQLAIQTLFSEPRCYKYVAMIQGAFSGWGAITPSSGEPPQRGWLCGMCFIILIHSRRCHDSNCTEGHQKKCGYSTKIMSAATCWLGTLPFSAPTADDLFVPFAMPLHPLPSVLTISTGRLWCIKPSTCRRR